MQDLIRIAVHVVPTIAASLFLFCRTPGCERAYIGARVDLGREDPALPVDLLELTLCCDRCRTKRPRLVLAGRPTHLARQLSDGAEFSGGG